MDIKSKTTNNIQSQTSVDRVEITYYTDPLCCWSWALEPQWRRLQFEYAGIFIWRYCMGGLLPSWKNFNDPTNNVSRPIQMGPVWMHAAQISGMPMNTRIWMEDPPQSSYPACIAVKAAQLQSAEAGEAYLRLVREAVFLQGKNIAQQSVLDQIAEQLSLQMPNVLNFEVYQQSLASEEALEAFRTDVAEVRSRGINRFPSFILRFGKQPAIIMTGYRPYEALVQALQQVYPQLPAAQKPQQPDEYASFWPSATERELAEIAV